MTPAEDAAPDDSDSEEGKKESGNDDQAEEECAKKVQRTDCQTLRPVLLSRGHSTLNPTQC